MRPRHRVRGGGFSCGHAAGRAGGGRRSGAGALRAGDPHTQERPPNPAARRCGDSVQGPCPPRGCGLGNQPHRAPGRGRRGALAGGASGSREMWGDREAVTSPRPPPAFPQQPGDGGRGGIRGAWSEWGAASASGDPGGGAGPPEAGGEGRGWAPESKIEGVGARGGGRGDPERSVLAALTAPHPAGLLPGRLAGAAFRTPMSGTGSASRGSGRPGARPSIC